MTTGYHLVRALVQAATERYGVITLSSLLLTVLLPLVTSLTSILPLRLIFVQSEEEGLGKGGGEGKREGGVCVCVCVCVGKWYGWR